MITFNQSILDFLALLQSFDHEAFVVGGSVRDALIGRLTQDVDITTSASIDELKAIFKDNVISLEGVDYQSLSVLFHNQIFQVTSYRHDSEYEYHRFPKTHRVISYRDDVWRRDFTMNGLYWNPQKGLIDLVDGVSDIRKKEIRTIGDPTQRFIEDALRILRAIRFASECDFSIEATTYEALNNQAHLIKSLSRERITQEVIKTLNGNGVERTHTILKQLFKQVFSFEYYYHDYSFTQVVHPLVKWLLVFKPKHQSLFDVMNEFAFTRKQKDLLIMMDEHAFVVPQADKVHIKELLKRITMDAFGALCQLHCALYQLDESTFEEIMRLVSEIHLNEEPYTLAQLKIKGDECVRRKMPYLKISQFLNACLEDVIQNPDHNNLEYLTSCCDEWVQKERQG
jgi:tRNA nucleotidyltransferase (CCA-adding enzyme)